YVVPWPPHVGAEEALQRSDQIREMFYLAIPPSALRLRVDQMFITRTGDAHGQIVVILFGIIAPNAQAGFTTGQIMTVSGPFGHDLRHIVTHKCSLFRLKPCG